MSTVRLSYASPEDPLWKRLLIEGIERAGGRRELECLYAEVLDDPSPMHHKWALALERLRIEVSADRSPLAHVPPTGPVIVLGNHPFGILDGLILFEILASLRDDHFVLVNALLCRDERLESYFLPIDFEPSPAAVRTNVETRKQAIERLRRGGALGIFPGGGVATAPGGRGRARELEWKRFVAKLIHMTRATVVPLYFAGQNSRAFQMVSQLSMTLRLAMFLHEVRRHRGRTVDVRIGEPISYETLADLRRPDLMKHLWRIVHDLGGQEDAGTFSFPDQMV